jgi:two-component system, OmpR family, sensor kinase
MSLRVRLTLLYISLLAGLLLVFGVAIYITVSRTLTNQVDETLIYTADEIIRHTSIDERGELDISPLAALDLPANVYVQIWDREGRLRATNVPALALPLDEVGFTSIEPVRRDAIINNFRFRVLSAPLVVGFRDVGVLQVGAALTVVETTQNTLLIVLIIGTLIAITIAGLAGWISTNKALTPLEDVTHTALQITRADDLSRRIPYKGPPNDEVGQLINAFNRTLSRLESLFNTQRRFMADVGHELRTPLTVIKGNVELMRRFGFADEESLAGIESEVDRLTRLVGDLLLLAQAESGKLPLDNRLVELDTLLLEALHQIKVLTREKMNLRLGEIDQVLVCGDQDRLKQVMVNLLGNAINHTPPGGEVVVSVSKEGDQAKLVISDTGPGIPPEDLPHIFERFYRGEKSRTRSRDGKGFGLGLSIAYWIVQHHGGRIEVDSTLGKGATFCVWLPLGEEPCTLEKSPDQPLNRNGG